MLEAWLQILFTCVSVYFIYLFKNKQKYVVQALKKIQTSKFLEMH